MAGSFCTKRSNLKPRRHTQARNEIVRSLRTALVRAKAPKFAIRITACANVDEILNAPTARNAAERMPMDIADTQIDPVNPPGCLPVQGDLPAARVPRMSPSELAARRALTEEQLHYLFVLAKAEGDLKRSADPAALARYPSAVSVGMGAMASSGAHCEAVRQVATVSVKAFEEQSIKF